MNGPLGNPTFVVYAIACIALCLKVVFVWTYGGGMLAEGPAAN